MKWTKLLSGALAGCLAASMLAGCGATPEDTKAPAADGGNQATTPSAPEAGGKVRIMSAVTGGKDEAEMKLFQEALSKGTGLEISIEKPPSDYNSVLMQKLQGGEVYDIIYVGDNYHTLIDQGALMDLTDYVKGSEILSKNVEQSEWDDITVDGKIYAAFNKKELHRVVALNKTMLEEAGIDYKTIEPTLDGYYNVFKKLREANPDKDFYPFNAVLSEAYDLQPWMAVAGLKDGIQDGKVPYASAEAKVVYEWLKKLYDENLLDPASFVDQTKDMRGKMGAASKKTAVCVDWAMWVGLHNANAIAGGIEPSAYEVVSLPGLKTPDGSYMLVKGGASLFGIPTNAANPDGAIKVLEYFATQEGGELLSVGIEGHDYNIENGKYVQTEDGLAHANDHGAPLPIYQDFEHPIGFNPGVDEALTYVQYASTRNVRADEKDYKTAVGKWIIAMVKGEVSIDDGIQKMEQELKTLEYI